MANKRKNTDSEVIAALESKVNNITEVVEQMGNQISYLVKEHHEVAVSTEKLNINIEAMKVLLQSTNNEVMQMKVTVQHMDEKQKESTISDEDKVYLY